MKNITNFKDKANSLYIKLGVAMTTSPLLSTIALAADDPKKEEAAKKAGESNAFAGGANTTLVHSNVILQKLSVASALITVVRSTSPSTAQTLNP